MARKLYSANNEFMFRIPTSEYIEIDKEEDFSKICRNKEFREKIRVASPALIEAADRYFIDGEKLSEKKEKNLYSSLKKYYMRSIERTTPFGLFAGIGVGRFGKETIISDENMFYVKSVNIDMGWLWEYIVELEKKYSKELSFKWNDACIDDGNRNTLLYTTTQDIEEISVRRTQVLEIIEKKCQSFVEYKKIVAAVQEVYTDTSSQVIEEYVDNLIDNQILISELRPPILHKNQLGWIIEKIKKVDTNIAEALIDLDNKCREYEGTKIGDGEEIYSDIIEYMKGIHHSKYYIQVDTNVNGADIQLEYDVKRNIEKLSEDLVKLSSVSQKQKEYMDRYRDKFIEKYGFERKVPLTEMIDTVTGIGAPVGYTCPSNDFFENNSSSLEIDNDIRNYFINKYEEAIRNNTNIQIKMDDLIDKISESDKKDMPASFEMYFKLKKVDDKIKVIMSENGGSFYAGKTFGRFALNNPDISETLFQINKKEKELQNGRKSCEISFLPNRMRNGNVMRCPTARDMVLSAYVGEEKDKESIGLKDILIGATEKRFYAIDARTGEEITFGMNNMYNILLQPNVYRFLLEIAGDGEVYWSEFPWRYVYQYFKHIPQIELDGIVLSEEQWFVSSSDFEEFSEYKEKMGIPDMVYLTEDDNRILLNLNQKISLQILMDEIKKKKGQSVLLERKEEGEEINFGGSKHSTEIVVPIFRNQIKESVTPSAVSNITSKETRVFLPFDKCIYFKLYCKHERETELISMEINSFSRQLEERYGIKHFFMRYIDTKPHIRLRFFGDQLYAAMPEMMEWINQLQEKNIIGEMSINQYEREVERYGGTDLINYAENLFIDDSRVVEVLLLMKRIKKTSLDLEYLTILSVLDYLDELFDDYKEMLEFCEDYYHSNKYIGEFREKKESLLALFNARKSDDYKELLEIMSYRRNALKEYKNIILKDKDKRTREGIYASVLHLHCNRMLGINRELESKVMSFVEGIIYAQKHFVELKGA